MDTGLVSSPSFLLFSPSLSLFLSPFSPASFKAAVYLLSQCLSCCSLSSFLSNHLPKTRAWGHRSGALLLSCLQALSQSLLREKSLGGRMGAIEDLPSPASTGHRAELLPSLISAFTANRSSPQSFAHLILCRMRLYLLHRENRGLTPGPAFAPNSPPKFTCNGTFSPASVQIPLGLHPAAQELHGTMSMSPM